MPKLLLFEAPERVDFLFIQSASNQACNTGILWIDQVADELFCMVDSGLQGTHLSMPASRSFQPRHNHVALICNSNYRCHAGEIEIVDTPSSVSTAGSTSLKFM